MRIEARDISGGHPSEAVPDDCRRFRWGWTRKHPLNPSADEGWSKAPWAVSLAEWLAVGVSHAPESYPILFAFCVLIGSLLWPHLSDDRHRKENERREKM